MAYEIRSNPELQAPHHIEVFREGETHPLVSGLTFEEAQAHAHRLIAQDNGQDVTLGLPGVSAAQPAEEKPRIRLVPGDEEEVTTDPQEKLRRSLKLLRQRFVAEAESQGVDDVVAAAMDVLVAFVVGNQSQAKHLERVADAIVAQTKILAMAYSAGLSDEEKADRLQQATDLINKADA